MRRVSVPRVDRPATAHRAVGQWLSIVLALGPCGRLLRSWRVAFLPPLPGAQTFADVPLSDPFARWIAQLAADGITGGCAVNPARYCPDQAVTRGQMAVFLVRTFSLPLQP